MTRPEFAGDGVGPVAALVRRWWIALLLVALVAVLGAVFGLRQPPQYTAESRLVVGSNNLSSYQVPGFAVAAQQLASNYARYVDNSSTVSRTLEKDLGSHARQLVGISGSPIAGSDVISVEVVATSRIAAKEGARSVAHTLVKLTASGGTSDAPALLKNYNKLAGQVQSASSNVGDIQTRLSAAKRANRSITSLTDQLDTAKTNLAMLKLQATAAASLYQNAIVNPPSDSRLSIITSAAIVDDNSAKTVEIDAIAGAVIGLLVALVVATLLERRRTRKEPKVFFERAREPVGAP